MCTSSCRRRTGGGRGLTWWQKRRSSTSSGLSIARWSLVTRGDAAGYIAQYLISPEKGTYWRMSRPLWNLGGRLQGSGRWPERPARSNRRLAAGRGSSESALAAHCRRAGTEHPACLLARLGRPLRAAWQLPGHAQPPERGLRLHGHLRTVRREPRRGIGQTEPPGGRRTVQGHPTEGVFSLETARQCADSSEPRGWAVHTCSSAPLPSVEHLWAGAALETLSGSAAGFSGLHLAPSGGNRFANVDTSLSILFSQ
jgi:hypothetical protein